MDEPIEAALDWLHQQGLTEAIRTADGIHHPVIHVRVREERMVGPAAVQEAFVEGAASRRPAMVFATQGFSAAASNWGRRAGVGLVALRGERAMVNPAARAILLEHVVSRGDWSWLDVLHKLHQLPRAGSIEGQHRYRPERWAITRLRWLRYQLDTPDGQVVRGSPVAMLDILRGTEPLDLDDYEITVNEW